MFFAFRKLSKYFWDVRQFANVFFIPNGVTFFPTIQTFHIIHYKHLLIISSVIIIKLLFNTFNVFLLFIYLFIYLYILILFFYRVVKLMVFINDNTIRFCKLEKSVYN